MTSYTKPRGPKTAKHTDNDLAGNFHMDWFGDGKGGKVRELRIDVPLVGVDPEDAEVGLRAKDVLSPNEITTVKAIMAKATAAAYALRGYVKS